MSDFTICPDQIRSVQESLEALARNAEKMACEAEAVFTGSHPESAAMYQVHKSTAGLCVAMRSQGKSLQSLSSLLQGVLALYLACEDALSSQAAGFRFQAAQTGTVKEVEIRPLSAQSKLTAKSKVYSATFQKENTKTLGEIGFEKTYEELGFGYQAPSKGKITTMKGGTALGSAELSGAASAALWTAEKTFSHGSASASFLQAEAHGSLSAGLYADILEEKVVADPRINAKAGASVCLLSGEASASVGNKQASLGGEVSASVGKAEGSVTAKAGLRDKKGNISPYITGKVSAEATAAEAEASVKASLLGVDAKAKAGVSVGVGAHADVSIGAGKIKAEAGASLGIGVEAGFEIDVSGAVKAICDCASAVADLLPF